MFVTKNHSRFSSTVEKTSSSSYRCQSTKKNYLNLVTPSINHETLILPVEEIKLLSWKNKKQNIILPLEELLRVYPPEDGKKAGGELKLKERGGKREKGSTKYRKQPKSKASMLSLEEKTDVEESPSGSRAR